MVVWSVHDTAFIKRSLISLSFSIDFLSFKNIPSVSSEVHWGKKFYFKRTKLIITNFSAFLINCFELMGKQSNHVYEGKLEYWFALVFWNKDKLTCGMQSSPYKCWIHHNNNCISYHLENWITLETLETLSQHYQSLHVFLTSHSFSSSGSPFPNFSMVKSTLQNLAGKLGL